LSEFARNSLSRCSNSTKIVVRWGFAPDPNRGAYSYSTPPDPLAGFKGPTPKGRGGHRKIVHHEKFLRICPAARLKCAATTFAAW